VWPAARAGDEDVDDISVLGVDHRQQAALGAAPHDLKDLTVLQPQPAVVGGEDLQRRDPFSRQAADLFENVSIQPGDVHMEGEIDGGFSVGFGVPFIQAGAQRTAGRRRHKIHDRGRSAEGGGLVTGVVVVGGDRVEHRQVEMRVGRSAGENELAGNVDHLGVFGGRPVDGDDRLSFDEDVGPERLGVGDERAAREQRACRHRVSEMIIDGSTQSRGFTPGAHPDGHFHVLRLLYCFRLPAESQVGWCVGPHRRALSLTPSTSRRLRRTEVGRQAVGLARSIANRHLRLRLRRNPAPGRRPAAVNGLPGERWKAVHDRLYGHQDVRFNRADCDGQSAAVEDVV
jgi:hypothetical protein